MLDKILAFQFGDVYITGDVFDMQNHLISPDESFVIENSMERVVMFVDMGGDLYLKDHVNENHNFNQ